MASSRMKSSQRSLKVLTLTTDDQEEASKLSKNKKHKASSPPQHSLFFQANLESNCEILCVQNLGGSLFVWDSSFSVRGEAHCRREECESTQWHVQVGHPHLHLLANRFSLRHSTNWTNTDVCFTLMKHYSSSQHRPMAAGSLFPWIVPVGPQELQKPSLHVSFRSTTQWNLWEFQLRFRVFWLS